MSNSDGQVRIIIDTNAESAAKQLDEVSKAFNTTGKSAEDVTTVFSSLQNGVNRNIEALREMALGGGQNSKEFQRLAQQTRDYQDILQKANSTVDKAVGGISKQSNGMASLQSVATKLIGGYVGLRGAQLAFQKSMESVAAFRTQERAINSLNNTLQNAGVYSYEYSKNIQELASQIQSYSNYGDEAIIKAQALGQSFIGAVPMTDKLTKAVVDFAAATGMDLDSAFTLVGKSIGSNTNALGRYGVQLQKGMTESQKMEAITKQLGDRYAGQAAQMADSSIQLKNATGDLAEAFGNVLDPAVKNTQQYLINLTKSTTDLINHFRVAKSEINNLGIADLQSKLRQVWVQQDKNNKALQEYYKGGASTETRKAKKLDEEYNRLKKEESLINSRLSELYKAEKEKSKQSGLKGFKVSDDIVTTSKAKTVKHVKEIKDAFEQAQDAYNRSQKTLKAAITSFGETSPQVAKALADVQRTGSAVNHVEEAFKRLTASSVGSFEQLQQKMQETQKRLQDLAICQVHFLRFL